MRKLRPRKVSGLGLVVSKQRPSPNKAAMAQRTAPPECGHRVFVRMERDTHFPVCLHQGTQEGCCYSSDRTGTDGNQLSHERTMNLSKASPRFPVVIAFH